MKTTKQKTTEKSAPRPLMKGEIRAVAGGPIIKNGGGDVGAR